MSKSVRRFLSFLLVLQLIIPYSTFAAAVGEFTSVVGEVTQTRAKEVITPVAKSPIELKDLIATDRNSSTSMVFSDDSTIMLSENTKLEIKEFLFKEKSRTGIFSLAIGKVTAAVNKFIGGDNVFEVHSPTAVVGVRGTGFEFIESKVGDATTATVICTEGSLTISALSAAGVIISTSVIVAGQTAVISGGIITVSATIAGAAAAAGAGLSTAGAGLSTGAIIGITAGVIATAGGIAAAVGGAGGGDKSNVTPTPTPTPAPTTATLSFRLYENSSDDFDMIITKPNGAAVYYYSGSEYSQDSISGAGPDIAYWQSPLRGTYSIQVQCYTNSNPSVTKDVSLEVWQSGVRTATLASFTVPGNTAAGTIVRTATYTY